MKIHPQEPSLKELYKIRSYLYRENVLDMKKIHAIEVQIKRHKEINLDKLNGVKK